MSQMERIAFIDRRIRHKGGVRLKDICDHFEVSDRQAKRDIEYMRNRLLAEIEYSNEKRCYIYKEVPASLDNFDEKTLLFYVFMKRIAENMNYLPIISDVLLNELSGHISRDYFQVSDKIEYDLTEWEEYSTEDVFTIIHSFADQRIVHLVYHDVEGNESERMIESARLINYSGKWYMVAWDLSCNDFRTFLISRIVRATLTKEPFAGGWGEERLKKHLSSGFGIFKSEDVTNAVIRFYHQVANIVSRQNWHSQQTTLNGSDEYGEYFEIKLPVGNFTELLGKVLRYGAKARIVLPTKLKKAWEKEIREMEKMIE